jgi:hypothetical protein
MGSKTKKNGPGKPGPQVGEEPLQVNAAAIELVPPQQPWKSEAEIGKVAVAYRDAGMRHQQAIDGDHDPI